MVEVTEEGVAIWRDTISLASAEGPLRAAVAAIEASRLPPGSLELRARQPGGEAGDSTTLLIALTWDWLAADYQEAMSYLRYAGTPAQVDSLRSAPPGERAGLLSAFWKRRDPDPGTPDNEFFDGYFSRIRDANDRFSDAVTPGWLTDRGAVYVTLGPPDEVLRHLDTRQGPEQSQVWLYKESLGFEVRLVFIDLTGAGSFALTVESRRVFSEAVETIHS